jgi:hypothetical protein
MAGAAMFGAVPTVRAAEPADRIAAARLVSRAGSTRHHPRSTPRSTTAPHERRYERPYTNSSETTMRKNLALGLGLAFTLGAAGVTGAQIAQQGGRSPQGAGQ